VGRFTLEDDLPSFMDCWQNTALKETAANWMESGSYLDFALIVFSLSWNFSDSKNPPKRVSF
jgi:hypothetical protein